MRRLLAAALAVPLLTAPAGAATPPAAAASPAATATAPPTASAAPATAPKPLTLEALRGYVRVREPQAAPDGSRVAYVRAVGDYAADRFRTELVLVDVRSGERRVLVRGREGLHAPRWSPSGDRLAYLALPEHGKPPQLYVLPLAGGDSQQITTVKAGVDAFAWRPDGAGFAYAAGDDPPKSKAPADYVPAFPVGDEHFLTREPSRPAHLWTVAADGKGARQLTRGAAAPSAEGGDLSWTPDGRAIVVPMQPDAVFAHFTKTRTVLVDAKTGAVTPLAVAGTSTNPVVAPDGTRIALALPRHGTIYLQNDVSVRDLADGHELASSVALDRNPHWFGWAPDGRTLWLAAAEGVRDLLWQLPPTGPARKVDLGEVDFAPDASVARDGTLAFVGTRPDAGAELYVLTPGATAPRKLTDENAFLRDYALGKRERFDWTSDDGTPVAGVLTYPVGYQPGRKYPLVLDIHGGPVATSTRDFEPTEAALDEILAGRGFLVLQPNYRGSDNAGDAFLGAIVPHVASGPGRDNLAGVAALEKLGLVDERRIGVSGWSGGGLQTSWLIGHASFWRAAVSGAAVNDWYEQAVLADINEQFASDFLGGASPWTPAGRALFRAESPLTYAGAIRTPLLILSDTGDQRVPITQSYALYRALRNRGRTVSFIALPRTGHFPTDPVGRETVLRLWSGWLERWLK